jgi:predicted methyltransferase
MDRIRKTMLASVTAVLLAGGTAAVHAAAAPAPANASAAITAAVADARRPAADKARDAGRKPAETVAFAGVKPGDKVAELGPGGGYYTRVLAATVGPQGKVYAVAGPCAPDRPTCLDALKSIQAAYGNVEIVSGGNLAFKTPEPVDVVWTTENYHDFHNGPTANIAALNKNVFNNLKPGGIFFVEDHSAAPGAGLAAAAHAPPAGRGRMDEAVAKAELQAAGFRLDAESNHLRNPSDDKNAPAADGGPSTSDRFAFRMKKPG